MGEGAVSATIRFICHLPFGYYAFNGVSRFTFVKDHMGILLAPPLGPRVLVGEAFAGPLGVIGFLWNFFLWIPTIGTTGGGLVLLGVVDAIITGFIVISLGIEASYIGFTHAQCAQLKPNATFTSNLIFFQRVAEVEIEDRGIGESTCQAYYTQWYVGLIVAILYASSATANVLIGSSSRRTYSVYRSSYSTNHWLLSSIPPISQIIPVRVKNALFFASRYIRHWLHSKGFGTKKKLPDDYILLTRHIRNSEGQDKGLPFLLSHNVIEQVVRQLHYVDVVNLGLASKRIREVMFPRNKSSTAKERRLRYYSCWGKKKSDCWTCGIQICNECSRSKPCAKSSVSFHISLCAAACSKCYYKTLSYGHDMTRPCNCTDGRRKGYTYSYGTGQSNLRTERLVCRDCGDMKEDEILALRERRDQAVYSNLTQQPLSCSICSEYLPLTALRWWICSSCKRECRNNCH